MINIRYLKSTPSTNNIFYILYGRLESGIPLSPDVHANSYRFLDISGNGGTTTNHTVTPTNGILGVLKLTTMLSAGNSNVMRMSNPSAFRPYIDRIAVVEQT